MISLFNQKTYFFSYTLHFISQVSSAIDWIKTTAGELGHTAFKPTPAPTAISQVITAENVVDESAVATTSAPPAHARPPMTLLKDFSMSCTKSIETTQPLDIRNPIKNSGVNKPWPFLVRLGNGKCAGTLISKNHFITSAHCCEMDQAGFTFIDFEVEIGLNPITGSFSYVRKIDAFKIHPNYSVMKLNGDLCVAQFTETVEYGRFTQPLCVETTGNEVRYDFANTFVAQWTPNQNAIEEAHSNFISQTECAISGNLQSRVFTLEFS